MRLSTRLLLVPGAAATLAAASACENITNTPCLAGPAAVEAYLLNTSGNFAAGGATIVATRAGSMSMR